MYLDCFQKVTGMMLQTATRSTATASFCCNCSKNASLVALSCMHLNIPLESCYGSVPIMKWYMVIAAKKICKNVKNGLNVFSVYYTSRNTF